MFKVVLDTNVLISSVLTSTGPNARVFDLALNKVVDLYVSKPILDEYREVLSRPRFALSLTDVRSTMRVITEVSIVVYPTRTVTVSPDESDNRFLECAEASGADYLVTGNKRDFPKRWKHTAIVNAKELLEFIALRLQK